MTIPKALRKKVYLRADGLCQNPQCEANLEAMAAMPEAWRSKYLPAGARVWEVDHIVPRSQGGTDELDNLQVLCGRCHREKSEGEDYPLPVKSAALSSIKATGHDGPRFEGWGKSDRLRAKAPLTRRPRGAKHYRKD